MRIPFPEPRHLFIDGPVAIYLSEATRPEIMGSMERLQKIVHLAASLMPTEGLGVSHVDHPADNHVHHPRPARRRDDNPGETHG